MPITWIQVRDVLDEALQIPAEDRSRYLDGACPQPELRRYVDSLIISYEKANEFLERPAFDRQVDLPGETEPSGVWVGRRIGPYRIEQEIGQGGMGTVFRAVRADDEYHKRVAIKLVRGGFASNFALAQFKEERQILAGLEHPNIARLLDGGRTDAGFPYLVMELVEGAPIDEYCDARKLSISERLELFRTVCAAVQFAHQNLVIHRDLKPANILVSADGTPKLLDFGIAKLVSPETLSPAPEQTVSFLRMMTPEYASPEQVRGDPISTATDVYSLGLVLYSLLSGHQPYQLTCSSPQALIDIICDTEPVKPSEIVSRTETIGGTGEKRDLTITPESVSSARGAKPDKLRHRLSGDLDNIVLMALRKDPQRRYSSVEQFSDDIRRHLTALPVRAREDTVAYRSSKFVKRHKLVVAAFTLFIITLLGGIVATARQARIARAERARAERRFNDVRKLATSLIFDVHDSIQNLPGATPVRKLIIDRAVHYLDSLETEAPDDIDLQRELAWAYQRVGLVQGDLFAGNLGDSRGALESIRKAGRIWEDVAKTKSATLDDQINNAYGHRVLSNMLAGAMEAGSREQGRQAVAISEHLFQIAPTHARVRRELGRDYESLAGHEEWEGDYAAALANLRKAYQLQKETFQAKPADPDSQRGLAELSVKIGQDLAYLGFREEGLQANREGVEIYRALAKDQSNALMRRELAAVLSQQGLILLMDGKPLAALQSFRESLAIVQRLAAADPQDTLLQDDIGDYLAGVGHSLLMAGQVGEGVSTFDQAERLFERKIASGLLPARYQLAVYRLWFGEGLARNGRVGEALEKFRAAQPDLEIMAALPTTNASSLTNLATAHLDIASALSQAGDQAVASLEFHRAIEIAEPPATAGNQQAQYTLADAYSGLARLAARGSTREDLAQAQALFGQSLTIRKAIHNPGTLSPGGFATGSLGDTARALDACNARLAKLGGHAPATIRGMPRPAGLLGWDFANRTAPRFGRECDTTAASCCGRPRLG